MVSVLATDDWFRGGQLTPPQPMSSFPGNLGLELSHPRQRGGKPGSCWQWLPFSSRERGTKWIYQERHFERGFLEVFFSLPDPDSSLAVSLPLVETGYFHGLLALTLNIAMSLLAFRAPVGKNILMWLR